MAEPASQNNQFDDLFDESPGPFTNYESEIKKLREAEDQFADLVDSPSSFDMGVAGEQFVAGAGESTVAFGGMMAGGKMGAQVPGPPMLRAATTVLGGIGGLLMGGAGGRELAELVGFRSPEELPKEQRPLAYGARTLGGSVPFILAPYAAAGANVKVADEGVGILMNKIINTAKTNPRAFAAFEAGSATSAATASGAAEAYFPGQEGVRIGAEMVGGITNPAALSVRAYRTGANFVRKLISNYSSAARETIAGKQLQELFDKSGEDPALVIRILQEQGVMDENRVIIEEGLTAAQVSGSETLGALQQYLMKQLPEFDARVKKDTLDALDAMRGLIAQLSRTGDPEALQAAAQMRSQYVRTALQTLVDNATNKAIDSAAKITDDTPAAREVLSVQTRESLDAVVSEVRKAESQLWDAVPGDVDGQITNLRSTFEQMKQTIIPELHGKNLPKVVSDFLRRVDKKPENSLMVLPDYLRPSITEPKVNVKISELKQLRSELLDLAREAGNTGNYSQARNYSDLANAVLDDIDGAFENVSSSAYQEARRFSKEMNDVFTRSFVGKATGTGKYGDRIAPELLLRKALAAGKEAGALNFAQLEEATRFLDVRGMGSEITQEASRVMMEGQERFTRLMFAEAVNPNTGKVNTTRLANLMRQNETILNRFPEIKAQLQLAMVSEKARVDVEDFVKGTTRYIENTKVFETLVKGDPVIVAQRMLTSPTIEKEMRQMVALGKGGGKTGVIRREALKGLSASIHAAAVRLSTDSNGQLNLERYKNLMTRPPVQSDKAPLDLMLENKVIDKEHYDNMMRVFDIMDNIETARIPGVAVEPAKGLGEAAMKFFARVAGTTFVGAASKSTGGQASIQAHAAGANLGEYITKKMPAMALDDIWARAMYDKDFMITLLKKVETPAQAEEQARQINAWLLQSGVSIGTAESEQEQ